LNWGAASRLQRFWDIRAACNFIGGGTGSSLLWWAALGMIAGLPYFPAALIGLSFIAAGLIMVWLEIGRPWRALNVFHRPQTSWMTRESIIALPLFIVAGIAILVDAGTDLPLAPRSPVVPAMISAVLALAFLYCQLRIIHSAQALPAWREPRAMPLLGLSGLAEGFAEGLGVYLLVTAILGDASTIMMVMALLVLIARAFAWHVYIVALGRSAAPEPTLAALIRMRSNFLIAGHVFPALLIIVAYSWPPATATFSALAGIAAALAGWLLKITLVTKAGYIPELIIPTVPVRGRRDHPAAH
jgi:phenylacetyl-CoA:acceptor oxidoreductase subunit 2